MRLIPLALLAIVLAACASTAPYSHQDLVQVTEGIHLLPVDYIHFKQAYMRSDGRALAWWYAKEQRDCKVEDEVDKRDTIDPNIRLFAASILVVDMCNDIDGAWAYWAHAHHMKYDKDVLPPVVIGSWVGGDLTLKLLPKALQNPGALA